MLWLIKEENHGTIGIVEKQEDIIKFLVYNEWIDEFTDIELCDDYSMSLWIILDLDTKEECTKEKIVEKFNSMSKSKFSEMLDKIGFSVEEIQPWNYAEYVRCNYAQGKSQ